MQKYILLDIDGVMVPASSWKPVELLPDGFYKFSHTAELNLEWILKVTNATIILTTTHRNKYNSREWKNVFNRRFNFVQNIQTIDDASFNCNTNDRLKNVLQWIEIYGDHSNYVIIDDDTSLNNLPFPVKRHWVKTLPMVGLNKETAEKALEVLNAF